MSIPTPNFKGDRGLRSQTFQRIVGIETGISRGIVDSNQKTLYGRDMNTL